MSSTPLPPPQQPSPQRPSTMAAVTQDAINSMKNFAKQIQLKGIPGLINEFNRIPSNVTEAEHKVCTDNPTRNRYKNIVCLDSTRVHLNWPPGTKNDYIHANWIGGFPELDKRLIATQAPLEKTIGDFWRMIWQEKAAVIVMLCQIVEEGKRKADKYWPSRAMEKIQAGGLSIENRFVDEQQDKQMRISTLVVKGRSSRTGEIREHAVTHVLWRGWPDRDVPASATNALQLLFKIGGGVPSGGVVVVHCSAGIGRTGTIIALEIALRKLLAGRELNIQGIVTKLREQRYKACQTYTQYLYIHYALLSYLVLKDVVSNEDFAAFREEYMKARKE